MAASISDWSMNERVRCRPENEQDWQYGRICSLKPLKVVLESEEQHFLVLNIDEMNECSENVNIIIESLEEAMDERLPTTAPSTFSLEDPSSAIALLQIDLHAVRGESEAVETLSTDDGLFEISDWVSNVKYAEEKPATVPSTNTKPMNPMPPMKIKDRILGLKGLAINITNSMTNLLHEPSNAPELHEMDSLNTWKVSEFIPQHPHNDGGAGPAGLKYPINDDELTEPLDGAWNNFASDNESFEDSM